MPVYSQCAAEGRHQPRIAAEVQKSLIDRDLSAPNDSGFVKRLMPALRAKFVPTTRGIIAEPHEGSLSRTTLAYRSFRLFTPVSRARVATDQTCIKAQCKNALTERGRPGSPTRRIDATQRQSNSVKATPCPPILRSHTQTRTYPCAWAPKFHRHHRKKQSE